MGRWRAHVDAVGLAFVVYGVLLVVAASAASVLCLVMAGALLARGLDDQQMLLAAGFYAGAALVAAGAAGLLAVPCIYVGVGIRLRRRWARAGGLACAALAVSNVPIGTLLAIWALLTLLDAGVIEEFEAGA